jgi:hypothetical protein
MASVLEEIDRPVQELASKPARQRRHPSAAAHRPEPAPLVFKAGRACAGRGLHGILRRSH